MKIVSKMESLLDELWNLRIIEITLGLDELQKKRYLEIVEILNRNKIEIPFGIEI